MPPSFRRAAAAVCLALALFAPVQGDAPQSKRLPTPEWVKLVDQGGRDPRLKGYQAPEGVKVEVAAEDPTVVNPVALGFAEDGTAYVAEWRPGPEPRKGAVKVLRDTAGNGVFDESRVVLEDDFPCSLLAHDGWLYVAGRHSVRRYKAAKPDGAYDVREVVLRGFGGLPRGAAGLALGVDGLLTVTAGTGDHVVEGSDGSRATVLGDGAVFRCRPDGSRVEVYAVGLRRPAGGPAFDAAGNLFCVDAGAPAGGCRLLHAAEGCDLGRLPPLRTPGAGEPAGLLVYTDTRFPERFRGLLGRPDPTRHTVRAERVERDGATFAAAEGFDLLRSDDPLFRPCQAVAGPDGEIYVLDRRGEAAGAGKHGRVYRLSWGGTADDPELPPRAKEATGDLAKLDDAGLARSLASEDPAERARVLREVKRRGAKGREVAAGVLRDPDAPAAARAAVLGLLRTGWDAALREDALRLLRDGDADLRRLAADALGMQATRGDEAVHDALLKSLADGDPAVRRAVALAMGRVGAGGAADALVNAVAFDDGRDAALREGLLRAVERLGPRGVARLVELAGSGVTKNTDKVVEGFAALRSRAAAEAIPTLLANPHLTIEQRATLLRSYGNYRLDPPVSLRPALDYLRKHADEAAPVKLAGLEVLSSAGALDAGEGRAWLMSLLDEPDPALPRAAVRALGATEKGAWEVGRLYLDGKLPRELRPDVAAALRRHAGLTGTLKEVERMGRD